MKAIVIKNPKEVLLEEQALPVPKEGEALLKLQYGGICGSDLNTYRGTFAYVTYPRVPGHEFSAEIVTVPENNLGLSKGMIVTANPYFNCKTCYSCRRGLVNCCTDNQTMGVQREGAFSEYITMPIERIYPAKGLDPLTLSLAEPFCIAYHGVQRAKVTKGDKVLIVGGGTIGILAAVAAKEQGAMVYVADLSQHKLDLAKEFGVDGVVLAHTPEAYEQAVKEFTNGDGFDVTIEAVGLPQTFEACINASAFGGRVVLIGVSGQTLDFLFTIIQKKELGIFGSRNATKADFEAVISLIQNSKVDLKKLISSVYPWEKAAEAFADFDKHAAQMVKVVLDFT